MEIRLKDITPIDRYLYSLALTLEQPFSPNELLEKVNIEHPGWKIELIRYRCKKFKKQKMLKKVGIFNSKRYYCLLTEADMENANYIFSPPIDVRNNPFISSL